MERDYIVLDHPGYDGVERLRDPLPRILYRAGMVIRLDDATDDVAGLKARGILADMPGSPGPEPPKPTEPPEPTEPRESTEPRKTEKKGG